MTTRARLQNANDSKSLWNYTLSPGTQNIYLIQHILFKDKTNTNTNKNTTRF